MDVLTNCPLCQNDTLDTFLLSKDYFLTGEEFSISACPRCGLKFTNPRPGKEAIGAYYASPGYLSHSQRGGGLTGRLFYAARKVTLAKKYRMIRKHFRKPNILDVGCGTGEFLSYCRHKGCKVAGVEPSASARKLAREKNHLEVYESLDLLPPGQAGFDVITLWHVLEHFHDPLAQLAGLHPLLHKDGILVIAVPNCRSYDAWLYGKCWAAYDLPRHLFHFDEQTLLHLLSETSFKPVRSYPLKPDAFYISLLSEKYKRGKNHYFKACATGVVSNLSGALGKGGYSSFVVVSVKS
jgi:SAM-dependent methyltransferase